MMDGENNENNGEKKTMNKWMIWGGKTTPIFGSTSSCQLFDFNCALQLRALSC